MVPTDFPQVFPLRAAVHCEGNGGRYLRENVDLPRHSCKVLLVLENVLHWIFISRTELLTCSALQNSYNNIKQQAERITRSVITVRLKLVSITINQSHLCNYFFLKSKHFAISGKPACLHREYNYRCYLKSFTCLGDHVQ